MGAQKAAIGVTAGLGLSVVGFDQALSMGIISGFSGASPFAYAVLFVLGVLQTVSGFSEVAQ